MVQLIDDGNVYDMVLEEEDGDYHFEVRKRPFRETQENYTDPDFQMDFSNSRKVKVEEEDLEEFDPYQIISRYEEILEDDSKTEETVEPLF